MLNEPIRFLGLVASLAVALGGASCTAPSLESHGLRLSVKDAGGDRPRNQLCELRTGHVFVESPSQFNDIIVRYHGQPNAENHQVFVSNTGRTILLHETTNANHYQCLTLFQRQLNNSAGLWTAFRLHHRWKIDDPHKGLAEILSVTDYAIILRYPGDRKRAVPIGEWIMGAYGEPEETYSR